MATGLGFGQLVRHLQRYIVVHNPGWRELKELWQVPAMNDLSVINVIVPLS